MKLSKNIPAHTLTEEFSYCKKDYAQYKEFKEIRDRAHLKDYPNCWWCKKKFKLDDMMALAVSSKGNKLLCQSCADELLLDKK